MDKEKTILDDLYHWCSYNGITDENKKELLSIIKNIKVED